MSGAGSRTRGGGKPDLPRDVETTTRALKVDLERFQRVDRTPVLEVLLGPETGRRIPLEGPPKTLGRTVDADVVFPDTGCSRRHARVSVDGDTGACEVEDLGSTNGTFVNHRRVNRARLEDGDKLLVGSTMLRFRLLDAVDEESGEWLDRYLFQDDLTGLPVKRRFFAELAQRVQRAAAGRAPLAVLMLDMDGLKRVNDTHGHHMGAWVISEAGRRIGAVVGDAGEACRFGGDEFTAYLDEADAEAGLACAERICEAIRATPFERDGVRLSLSISIGVAAHPEDGHSAEALTTAADAALYRAKAAGRDGASR